MIINNIITVVKHTIRVAYFLIFLSSVCFANTYYVDSEYGKDSNDGLSENSPWRSISKLNNTSFRSGDAIRLKSNRIWHNELNIKNSGTQNEPILITSYGQGDKPIIDGDNSRTNCIELNSSDYIVIRNIHLRNASNRCLHGNGSSNLIVENCIFENSANQNVYLGNANNLIVRNSVSRYAKKEHGLYIGGGSRNVLVENNFFYGNRGSGLKFNNNAGTSYVISPIIRNNKIYNNMWAGIEDCASSGAKYYNNIIFGNDKYGINFTSDPTYQNIGSKQAEVYNNTITVQRDRLYNLSALHVEWAGHGHSEGGHIVMNNIFYRHSSDENNEILIHIDNGVPNKTEFNFNLYYSKNTMTGSFNYKGNKINTLQNWVSNTGGQDKSSIYANPLFVNSSSHNYELNSDESLAVDNGTDLLSEGISLDYLGKSRPQGFGYDMGAFEFSAESSNINLLEPANLRVVLSSNT